MTPGRLNHRLERPQHCVDVDRRIDDAVKGEFGPGIVQIMIGSRQNALNNRYRIIRCASLRHNQCVRCSRGLKHRSPTHF